MPTALVKTRSMPLPAPLEVDPGRGIVHIGGEPRALDALEWDVPTTGTVYGALLNYRGALAALGDAVYQPPYKAPPKAPVLYIKPANTWIGYGAPIPMPEEIEAVEIGAALGVVIGQTACRVPVARALDFVAGYTLVNDVSVPHKSFYRPSIRYKCRDGFCPIGPWVLQRNAVANPDRLTVRVFVNGGLRQENQTANLIRSVAQLLADVSDFMTLGPGDVLSVGVPEKAPLARIGDRVAVEIEGIGRLENPVIAEARVLKGVLT